MRVAELILKMRVYVTYIPISGRIPKIHMNTEATRSTKHRPCLQQTELPRSRSLYSDCRSRISSFPLCCLHLFVLKGEPSHKYANSRFRFSASGESSPSLRIVSFP